MNKASDWAEREAGEVVGDSQCFCPMGKEWACLRCKVALALTKAELRGYEGGLEEAAKVAEIHYADLLGVEKYTKAGICQSVAQAIRTRISKGGEV